MSWLRWYKSGGVAVRPGRPTRPFVGSLYSYWGFNQDEPWALNSGETLLDNMPVGVPIVNASDYSSSNDIYEVLTAVDAGISTSSYVRLEANKTYLITQFRSYGTNDWRGWTNGSRKIMGLIGYGVGSTKIEVSPTAIANSPNNLRDYLLNPPTPYAPAPVASLYFSNTGTTVPLFITGIDFRGTLQGPYGVYSAGVQADKFRLNQSVSSPLPYRGISIWRALTGAKVQFCRFSGFGFSLNNSPPFENGAIESNYSNIVFDRLEIDGRIAGDINPARPRSGGGLMLNKESNVKFQNSYLHHTRRSGFATNTNTNDQAERYMAKNLRIEHITDGTDSWATDNYVFHASNVEAVVGEFLYDNCWFDSDLSGQYHINLAIPYLGTTGGQVLTLPSTPIIKVINGFRSSDPTYNGCLKINVVKLPNTTGTSPAWTKLNDLGIQNSNLFEVRNAQGDLMIGVRTSEWVSSMTSQTHYVVKY